MHRHRCFHAQCVRAMCRINRFQTQKKRTSTSQLLNDLKLKPIETYIDQHQMRWAGNVSCMPWNRLPQKMLTTWCNLKIPKGAPQMTYGRNLKKVFKRRSMDYKTWMVGSKDRIRWREKSDHSDNDSFYSSTFLVNNSSVIPRFKP